MPLAICCHATSPSCCTSISTRSSSKMAVSPGKSDATQDTLSFSTTKACLFVTTRKDHYMNASGSNATYFTPSWPLVMARALCVSPVVWHRVAPLLHRLSSCNTPTLPSRPGARDPCSTTTSRFWFHDLKKPIIIWFHAAIGRVQSNNALEIGASTLLLRSHGSRWGWCEAGRGLGLSAPLCTHAEGLDI